MNIKKIVKMFTPYGLIYLKRKNQLGKELQFQFDTNFKITGWMEPAHIKIKLDPKDWIQGRIIHDGGYEKEYITVVKNILPMDGIFFDIGANIGVYSLDLFNNPKNAIKEAWEGNKRRQTPRRFYLSGCTG